ncbi:helix-turn-helix domain-containing protein [Phycicoccus sp.]|uniref:ATP-binding protein n=1 Tax=Phycicoccus sp. TaxID=1902410 RepID=UPI002D16614F|nr:helix-turn-helix domain-containing protein [Phycicoccus sp.]HMM96294.1 helix-turn-helix domain-containing protein [Phycicoccus sp.]
MDAGRAPGDFATVLRRLRDARSLTQEELAERAGLTAKAVGALERGERRRPYPHTVRSLADGLGLGEDDRATLVAAVPPREPTASTRLPAPASPAERVEPPAGSPPVPATLLIGRDTELDALRTLVRSGTRRLVTLTGPGGVGKTRLAIELLHREEASFPGGAHAVDLAAVREPALVVPKVIATLGLPEAVETAPLDALVAHLQGLRVLLVLDNLEQVTGAAPVLAELVARCADLVVVATSRAPLRVRAEHEMVLAPLTTPSTDDVDAVAGSPAVALLLDRAAAAGAPTAVTGPDAPALAAIARHLDGLPLALELAAPGLRLLSPTTLLARLEASGPGAGPRDLPERHRTMSAVLDWSTDLLEPEEVGLFERLAVFSGGFSLDSVEAVVGGEDVVPALGVLVEQSLVLRVPAPDDQPRFRLLEPVRQYAMRRLHARGEATTTADRHAAHFHERAVAAHVVLQGPGLVAALDRLEADHANLRSAYLRLLELDRAGDAAELAGSLWLYLALRGHAREGLAWLERVDDGASDGARLVGLTGRLGLLLFTGDVARLRAESGPAVTLAGRVDDPGLTAETLILAGFGAVFSGDPASAEEMLRSGWDQGVAAGRPWVAVHARFGQAQAALVSGDLEAAAGLLDLVVEGARSLGNPFSLATSLNLQATLTELLGDEAGTAALLGEALDLGLEGRLSWPLGYTLPALAALALRVGDPASAAWLFGAAADVSAVDAVAHTFPVSRALSDRGLDATRQALDEESFTREWELGRVAGDAEIRARAAAVLSRARA